MGISSVNINHINDNFEHTKTKEIGPVEDRHVLLVLMMGVSLDRSFMCLSQFIRY